METPASIGWLTADDIAPALAQLFNEAATPDSDWSPEHLVGGALDTLGIWRVSGTASVADGDRPWSMVLKGYPRQAHQGSPTAFDWPGREAELYRSGLLEDLPGIAAPTCYGTIERDGAIWVWLDDLSPFPQPEWTLERFATLARAMGTMNGAWLAGRPLPDHRSLSRRWLEGWLAANDDVMVEVAAHRHSSWKLWPDATRVFLHLWNERHRHLEFLASMPQTFSHLDAHAKNSFIRPCNGQDEFVLIDWSFAGLAAPGEELAALVASSVMFVPSAFPIRDEIEATAFPAYLEGLSEAGWDGREEDIWRAYRSSLALRYGPGTLRFDFPDDPDEDARLAMEATFGMPFESLARLADLLTTWIADRATEML